MTETATQRKRRVEKEKQKRQEKLSMQDKESKRARLDRRNEKRQRETSEQRSARLDKDRLRHTQLRANETPEQRQARLSRGRQNMSQMRAEESPNQRQVRMERDRLYHLQQREQLRADVATFEKAINTFCDSICQICTKRCYPAQITTCQATFEAATYLPDELNTGQILRVCHRCKNHITSKKLRPPPKAYWNKLDPGVIPDVIQQLTQSEQRLLSRIIPFVKIIKLTGIFGQYGFRGQAVLFAQDIFEVSEKLLNMLPRSSDNAGIVVVTEHLENLNNTREYTIDRSRVYGALRWLIKNNPLYKDVIIDHNAHVNEQDLMRLDTNQTEQDNTTEQRDQTSAYVSIGEASRIVRASWHQGNDSIFRSGYAGVQCCAMVLANIVRAAILPPSRWNTLTLDKNMVEGDSTYEAVRILSNNNPNTYAIDNDGYLLVRNFDVIKRDFIMYNRSFSIYYQEDSPFFGSLQDDVNDDSHKGDAIGLRSLRKSLEKLFDSHSAGILITQSKSLGVLHYDNKYYFTNSHSCGAKGSRARPEQGRACIVECDNIEELIRVVKRATGSRNCQYTLDYIDVHPKNEIISMEEYTAEHLGVPLQQATTRPIVQPEMPITTTIMAPIDCAQPDVEDELEISGNLNKIVRKTRDNIVNEVHELRAEEFAWYFLFPNGINGLKEDRSVKITPLDYFQYRILGSDTRFQRTDYLFYALSMFEYYRIKSTIAACAKKIEGPGGQVEDIHLYIRKLRGSSAYWRTALNELVAQIRLLGPPTYFVTFSCNDLHWPDMKKALLIADGRPNEDPQSLDALATQVVVEKYPAIVSRHFMIRVSALMKFIRRNTEIFGGQVEDFWWRIEFQNRGSPHLHMVLWIKDHPSFDTPEGIQQLDRVCTCEMPDEGSENYELVKGCQIHRHTWTCRKKDPTSSVCRFSFPRQVCTETRIVAHSSTDFIKSGGRICLLKRRHQDRWVNNYNVTLLNLWQGNIDIQPCGSNESIAFYVAKYISKAEPTELDVGVARAIQQIRREETNISRKLFKICMRILKERQVSACECVYRLAHLNMRDSSRKCIFLNTRKAVQRYRMIQFDEQGRGSGYANNIFDRYENRPDEHPDYDFNNMSLIDFAMLFEPQYRKKPDDDAEGADDDAYEIEPELRTRRTTITLKNNKGKMVARKRPAVVRVPHFMVSNDPENYYYSLLLQYMPYRREIELIEEFDTAREAFLAREELLRSRHIEIYRERDRQLENAFNQVHAFQVLENPPPIAEILEDQEEEVVDNAMKDDQFQAAQRAMNMGQNEIFRRITRSIRDQMADSTDRERLFITGGAGTGKTFVFNLLKNQVNRCYGKQAVKVAALTGVAARLVAGQTIHSLLKLPVQKDGQLVYNLPLLTGNFLRIMRQQWKDTEFFFIDEISMVPYEMLCMIDSRLRQLKNNDELFGGLNVLLFGDLMQLPPIRGNQVFEQPERMVAATHLWRLFTLIELTENMRQQGDQTFINILNALRVGELREQYMVVLMDKVRQEATGEFSIGRALRIFPTNKQVQDHNQAVLQYFKAKNTQMFKIKAQDRLVDKPDENIDYDKITPKDINKTAGLPRELEVFVGAKVMLRSNIDISKGLVNGAIGHITEIIWPHFRRAQMYDQDIPTVRIDFGRDGIHSIQPISKEFPAKGSNGTLERRMLPIVLSWASTVHKMQGSTVDYAVIDLGKALFAAGQAYVALSRVRSLDGLQIQDLDCTKLTGTKPCNNEALAEMKRLRQIE